MNKYQKEEFKLVKKMVSNTQENAPLHKFKIARYYIRCCLNNRHKEFLDWYANAKFI
jgi:hypothetical protein